MRTYDPIPESESVEELVAAVRRRGFGLLRAAGSQGLAESARQLGRVLHVEEVEVREGSRALLSSRRALAPHTDHHRARWIAWLCLRQADRGGESLVIDGCAAVEQLSAPHQQALGRVVLHEHSIFDGDMERHPMLVRSGGSTRLYYSYWLADEAMGGEEREAFDAFADAVRRAPQHRRLLRVGDVLVVDNHRMLHGRTAIEGDALRHLRRHWLEEASGGR